MLKRISHEQNLSPEPADHNSVSDPLDSVLNLDFEGELPGLFDNHIKVLVPENFPRVLAKVNNCLLERKLLLQSKGFLEAQKCLVRISAIAALVKNSINLDDSYSLDFLKLFKSAIADLGLV
jgi:hypothetical protein